MLNLYTIGMWTSGHDKNPCRVASLYEIRGLCPYFLCLFIYFVYLFKNEGPTLIVSIALLVTN